jgi:hypothetical protein
MRSGAGLRCHRRFFVAATCLSSSSTWLKVSQVGRLNNPLRQQYFGLPTCHLAHLLAPSQGTENRDVGRLGLTITYSLW